MNKPVAILISDVHYNVHTLSLADKVMRQAIRMANAFDVRLVVAGDLHDTKANLRGECITAMRETFKQCKHVPLVLVGNHDLINEKSEANALSFLDDLVALVSSPVDFNLKGKEVRLLPYFADPAKLREELGRIPKGATLIMHQGCQGSVAGDYTHDKSALVAEDFQDFRVISGHYHTRQDIKTGRPRPGAVGLFSYIGNPYSLSFGEAGDPEKGFRVLNEDGTLDFIPTNLRKHIKATWDVNESTPFDSTLSADDLLWLKVTGSKEQLAKFNRNKVLQTLQIECDCRLEFEPYTTELVETANFSANPADNLDDLIESLPNTSEQRKSRLKELWRRYSCN